MNSISVRDQIWPAHAAWADGELTVAGHGVRALAAEFGTPLYVLDAADFRARCSAWLDAFPNGDVHYGGKAFLAPAVVGWLAELGLCLDVCSGGELAVARVGGMPPERVVFHGNNKSVAEIRQAVAWGVGCIVLDSLHEVERVARAAAEAGTRQPVMVRVKPGIDAATHASLATGGERTKFGMSMASGEAMEAVRRVLGESALEFIGLHSHIGSQIFDLDSFAEAARRMVGFLRDVERRQGIVVGRLDLGGGLGIPYLPGEKPASTPADLADVLHAVVPAGIRLAVEPGRAIAGPSTVAVYEVGTVKGGFVAVDGGMSDNPRPATYGAVYTAVLASRHSAAPVEPVTVVGKHCESGDVLIEDIALPADLAPGDLIAIPCSGAYQRSTASNYNLVTRPPVVAVHENAAHAIVRRETEEDLLRLYP
ncbi:diaminopimelate decarboxylase [Catenulispora acidiphila DSM 44928]|uniref:Diaminopimelate decarboxylase n=1 Tax=Catenulispora acidiphila (strain DSM 44928 / JCM 14897 / NBRC 102108 / NRRL B-24433 / ID139908) TaxID=479433 RepID=C7Q1P8_CATAD|nr:diaminopimelate decarboxylase [Catenulispora acidiphila]ACU75599.1 diaminopimelate decarboxylase [Catenulispora acidiphila DSM 44928]